MNRAPGLVGLIVPVVVAVVDDVDVGLGPLVNATVEVVDDVVSTARAGAV
jgi:hypothetical protein